MSVRILAESGNVFLSEIDVSADWATASNAVSDLQTALGMDLSGPNLDIFFHLWEGEADSDDIAVLKVIKSTGAASYEDEFTNATTWTSAPTSGEAYILGITVTD